MPFPNGFQMAEGRALDSPKARLDTCKVFVCKAFVCKAFEVTSRFASSALCVALVVLGLGGTGCDPSRAALPEPLRGPRETGLTPVAREHAMGLDVEVGRFVVFAGACDASGAVPLAGDRLVVADDEDNVLRVYDVDRGGAPLSELDLSPLLSLKKKKAESDLEAATLLGEHAYWLTSHGRNKKGKLKPERLFFFATQLPSAGGEPSLVGTPYTGLLQDLTSDPRLSPFGLERASRLPPKAPGGLNLEGLTATPDGKLLLGFRSPIPRGKALIVPLENPQGILAGERARLGEPLLLELSGLGVRALSFYRGRYLILAGPHDAPASKLFAWRGPGHAPELLLAELQGLNPEGFFTPEDRDEVMLLSDDGTELVDGRECKRSKTNKRFRGLWVRLTPVAKRSG